MTENTKDTPPNKHSTRIVFKNLEEPGSWFVLVFLGAIWIAFSTGGKPLSLIFGIPFYFGAIFVFSKRIFYDDRFERKIPLHFRRSKRTQLFLYENFERVKFSYVSGKYSNHFIEFKLRDDKIVSMVVFEKQHLKILQLLKVLIEKRIPVFVSNETLFLKKMNQDLKVECESEIEYSDQVTLQHTFFYLRNKNTDREL